MSETSEQLAGKLPPGRPILKPPLKPPLVPPPPVTFDFSVPSLTVKNPRALETDTDFATIAAAVLAPDGTQIAKYGPTSAFLGNLGKGRTIDPGMSLTGIDVPDGGSVALTFVVVNRGAWEGDSQLCITQEGKTPMLSQWGTVTDWTTKASPTTKPAEK